MTYNLERMLVNLYRLDSDNSSAGWNALSWYADSIYLCLDIWWNFLMMK